MHAEVIEAVCPSSEASTWPEEESQSLMVESLDAVMICAPSATNAKLQTGPQCASIVASSAPVWTSQTSTVPSSKAVATRVESEENVAALLQVMACGGGNW